MLMPSVLGSNCLCQQLLSLMKTVKSWTEKIITDKHLEGRVWIAVKIKPDTESSLGHKECQINNWWMIPIKKISE
jgi:hypothetical protein